jgi:hypothetical protein
MDHTQTLNARQLLDAELVRLNMEHALAMSVLSDLIARTSTHLSPQHNKDCERCVAVALKLQEHQSRIRAFRIWNEKAIMTHIHNETTLAQKP